MGKRYIANERNVLLNIDTFDYCTEASCADSINMHYIETLEEDAVYIYTKYRKLLYDVDSNNNQAIKELRTKILEELKDRKYNVDNEVKPIVYNE